MGQWSAFMPGALDSMNSTLAGLQHKLPGLASMELPSGPAVLGYAALTLLALALWEQCKFVVYRNRGTKPLAGGCNACRGCVHGQNISLRVFGGRVHLYGGVYGALGGAGVMMLGVLTA